MDLVCEMVYKDCNSFVSSTRRELSNQVYSYIFPRPSWSFLRLKDSSRMGGRLVALAFVTAQDIFFH